MITSPRNAKIKWVRELQTHSRARREAGMFVVEGVRLLEEALAAGLHPQWLIYSSELSPRGWQVLNGFLQQGVTAEQATSQALQSASDTDTPQGILAVLPIPSLPLPSDLHFLLILDELRDPGNLGTILRTACAAGVQAVFLSQGSVDPYAPKVVRSAMGAHFRLPIRVLSWPEIRDTLAIQSSAGKLHLFLADASGGCIYTRADFRLPLALIVGGEAQGASASAQALAPERVHIPMPGKFESLNAAVAAAILLFEVVRQRANSNGNP